MNKYSLKSFALLWMFILIFSFLVFLYLVLNLFFSEHITKSSLKDLKYTAYVAKLNLSEEQKKLENSIARHVSSKELHKALGEKDFASVKSFIKNWETLSQINKVSFYNTEGALVDLSSGGVSSDGVKLQESFLRELNLGYSKTEYLSGARSLSIVVKRKIVSEEFKNHGYLVEEKKIPYEFFLNGETERGLVVASVKKGVVFVSEGLELIKRHKEVLLSAQAEAFELAIEGESFDVVRLELLKGFEFFLVKTNLRKAVFKNFYKKYLSYFIFFLLFLMLIFYLSYYRQVFSPLQRLSMFIEGDASSKIETSVHEISLIAEKLEAKISVLSEDVVQSKKGRVEDVSRLVASVAHELNNSLSYLGANLTYLKDEMSSEDELDFKDCREAIASAESGYERIKKIVSDLRVFSSTGKMDVQWVEVSKFKAKLFEEFSEIDFSFPEELEDLEFKVDMDRSYQIVRNLVLNAMQAYSEQIQDKKILISFFTQDEEFFIAVRDWAGGISQEVSSKVFEPFFTTKKNTGGAGLGLSLSRNLAHEMGASLYIRETTSEGSTFCFTTRQFKLKV